LTLIVLVRRRSQSAKISKRKTSYWCSYSVTS